MKQRKHDRWKTNYRTGMDLKLIATILLFYYLKTQGFSLFRNSKIVFEHLYYLFWQPFLQFVNLRC